MVNNGSCWGWRTYNLLRMILFKRLILVLFFVNVVLGASAQSSSGYKMYKTRNYHNQLRLNTKTGEVQQIQDDGQSWTICSARELLGDTAGRFCLYARHIYRQELASPI